MLAQGHAASHQVILAELGRRVVLGGGGCAGGRAGARSGTDGMWLIVCIQAFVSRLHSPDLGSIASSALDLLFSRYRSKETCEEAPALYPGARM